MTAFGAAPDGLVLILMQNVTSCVMMKEDMQTVYGSAMKRIKAKNYRRGVTTRDIVKAVHVNDAIHITRKETKAVGRKRDIIH
jgi:translation elongation factor P/translation initiation factor 5A